MNKEEIINILSDNSKNDWLFNEADRVRHDFVGDEVHLRGLIEFSNICKRQCKYCGLRSPNKQVERYRILKDEIICYVQKAVKMGYKTIVLQSGEDNFYDTDKMVEIIREIKKNDVALTLSIGEKTFDEYKAFKEAGADRYLLRIETTNPKLYTSMHPNASFENRVQCLYNLKSLGYETGTGCLVGLPNQTVESLANDILFFKELDADMVGIGPFIPHHQTPFAAFPQGSVTLTLRLLAILRLMLPAVLLPATTALGTLDEDGREKGILAGANVIMPNLSPKDVRNKYMIYDNKVSVGVESAEGLAKLTERMKKIGYEIVVDRGDAKQYKEK